MPAYTSNPLAPVPMLLSGTPAYAFGSRLPGPPCRMIIDHDSVTSNVVTLTVTIVEGNIPTVGDLIYVYGTANSSAALNETTGIAIATVTITAATGKGTVTYAKTVSDQGSTVDTGYAISVPGEKTEALAVAKSQQFGIQAGKGRGISWSYRCPSAPSTIAVQLEGALSDIDTEYFIIGSSQTTAAGTAVFATVPEGVNFVRLDTTATTGGSTPTIIGKILLS